MISIIYQFPDLTKCVLEVGSKRILGHNYFSQEQIFIHQGFQDAVSLFLVQCQLPLMKISIWDSHPPSIICIYVYTYCESMDLIVLF